MEAKSEVLPDRCVLFSVSADKAQSVQVAGEFTDQPITLEQQQPGLWQCRTGPLEPNIYAFSFQVDGKTIIDSTHPKEALNITESLLYVPAEKPQFYDLQDVPHGKINVMDYNSVYDKNRRICVYTPSTYSEEKAYPVLFLLHGAGDTELTWEAVGRAHSILDNLIAAGQVEEMIAVMPFGHIRRQLNYNRQFNETSAVEEDITTQIIPFLGQHYSVSDTSATKWAIAGVSMGGHQALNIGLRHSHIFDSIGVFSGYPGIEFTDSLKKHMASDNQIQFWIGCGEDDYLLNESQKIVRILKSKQLPHQAHITDGFHSWITWRSYLHQFAQTLFRS